MNIVFQATKVSLTFNWSVQIFPTKDTCYMMIPHSVIPCGPVKMRLSPVYNLGTSELMVDSGIVLILET